MKTFQPHPSQGGGVFSFRTLKMPTIKINDQDYDADSLSTEAKTQLDMLLATEAEIRRLQTQLAIAQTARNAYARALAEAVK